VRKKISHVENEPKPSVVSLFTLMEAGISLVAIASLVAYLARYSWLADLLCQFRVQYMLILLPASVVYFLIKRRRTAAFFAICLIANSWIIAPHIWSGNRIDEPKGNTKRILIFNVRSSNEKCDEVLTFVKENEPDIFVAMEVNQRWLDRIQQRLAEQLPHQHSVPREDNFGIAVFSRLPFDEIEVQRYGLEQLPSLNGVFSINEKKINLIATHPLPPIRVHRAESRNQQLVQAATDLDPSLSRIMAGDFNLTPWSPHFSDILKRGGLISSAKGIQPTWYVFPTWLGGLMIDHVLMSPDIRVLDYRVGPNLGSDHRPVIVDFDVGD